MESFQPNPAVGRGEVRSFWGTGQGATTRNGATPQRDAGASERGRGIPCAARSPLRGAPRATLRGAPHSKELQRSHVPQKLCNPPRSGAPKR